MRKKPKITKVSNEIIGNLSEIYPLKQYKSNADIIYKGHVPHSGFLLVDGRITLKLTKDKCFDIFNGSLIGIKELIRMEPFLFDANIDSDSFVYILDKSTVGEILNGQNTILKKIFEEECI